MLDQSGVEDWDAEAGNSAHCDSCEQAYVQVTNHGLDCCQMLQCSLFPEGVLGKFYIDRNPGSETGDQNLRIRN